jgi:hypothetical protein
MTERITEVDDLGLATYLTTVHGYTLARIEGPAGGHRTFRFAEPIDPAHIGGFYASSEKRLIDNFRALKGRLLRPA